MTTHPKPGRADDWANRCRWCGHALHGEQCPREIETGTPKAPRPAPCPCNRNKTKENP